ncbi:ras-related protein Rab-34 isoform X3 [Astatotilapia calliptera]|uniref:ras-related protein Rab-34 isoform X3 n=1 Tax=Astatotilapia calliptera TaxID=8154 RepID=UPI000E404B5D|nr:ras-related protein Rab-34-like isoform X3 [Astatotilapia calliptera]
MRVCTSISCISMLPPVKKDRVITQLPKCFSANAALHTKEGFHPHVKAACQLQKADTVSFNVAKVIVVGDVAVGKTCLISRWDTAGQERFKCIASTYYRGAQAIIVVFDLSSVGSLAHARQWLEDAMKENDPSSVLLFLVGTKKDLSSPDLLAQIEQEAMRLSEEIKAEYWAVSAKSGDGVKDFFFRVASLTFEANVLSELERSGSRHVGDIIRITDSTETSHKPKKKPNCC